MYLHNTCASSEDTPASTGASAILAYGSIDSPLAQPRGIFFGHFFSALIGIIIATIFDFDLKADSTPRLQWLAACLAVAIALVVMHLTKTTHPPAGTTALLPCIDRDIWALKWYFLPVVLLSSTLIIATALLVNNIQRRYPAFWITVVPTPERQSSTQHRHRTPASPESGMRQEQHPPHREHPLRDLEAGR